MRDEPGKGAQPVNAVPDSAPIDPVQMARRDLRKARPRRFWNDVTIAARGDGFGVDLDGRPLLTPAKAELTVPYEALAAAIAEEWRAQRDSVEPDAMPVTRLVNSALDGVARAMDATIVEVAKFAETDLVCYRAGEPNKLVTAQSAAWDPVLAFAHDSLGARFICAQGVIYVEQPKPARAAVHDAVADVSKAPGGALRLAALGVMTSLTGSVLLALAVARRRMTSEAAWSAAHVDEDHQRGIWGDDPEALVRRDHRWRDMAAAAFVLDLSAAPDKLKSKR